MIGTDLLTFNGIDGSTGNYDIPPMSASDLARAAYAEVLDADQLHELRFRREQDGESHYVVKEGVDPKDLSQTGWGVIFPVQFDPAIREALQPLLEWRRSQASRRVETRYREYTGVDAYRPDESKNAFLARHGAGPGPVDPDKVPYYLLLVGDAEAIPFRFQYQLDVQYAVGRICFETAEEYAAYAQTVVEAESGRLALARRAAFFGVANPDDNATTLSLKELVQPLVEWVAADGPGWQIERYIEQDATKKQLSAVLAGGAPSLLFTASHGMMFPNGDPRQFPHQGALLCQDWPGPVDWKQKIPEDFYFAGDDVSEDARLFGMISMHFACFGAGTPRLNDFPSVGAKTRSDMAPRSFVAKLPQKLLTHRRGGALAAIGHVERAWGYSFHWDRAGGQTEVFKSTLKRLMQGHPVGSALEYFNGRYAELSSDLAAELQDVKYGKLVNEFALSGMWTANNDARSYTIVGDPAVRLMLADEPAQEKRPVIEANGTRTQATAPPASASTSPLSTSTGTSTPSSASGDSAAAAQYALLDPIKDAQGRIVNALERLVESLGASLAKAVESLKTIEVATYGSDNVADVKFEDGKFTGARLRAISRIGLDGNTLVCIPEQDGKIDDALWKIHSETVERALANRTEMLKAAAAAASNLLGALKRP